jgi:hypothetical protein
MDEQITFPQDLDLLPRFQMNQPLVSSTLNGCLDLSGREMWQIPREATAEAA